MGLKQKTCKSCRQKFAPSRPMQSACSPACAIAIAERKRQKQAQQDTVRTLKFDERFIRLWAFYLAYCEAAFDEANIDVVQFTLAKPG